jgi:hypothetical protein
MSDRLSMENAANVASIIALKRPQGLTRQQFDDYWANVHAPIMARMPALWAYSIHQMENVQLPYWSLPDSIDRVPADEHVIEGAAELLYLSQEDAARSFQLSDAPGGFTHKDAQNFLWVGLFYQSNQGSKTLIDPDRTCADTTILAFTYRPGVDRQTGHEWVARFAECLAKAPQAQRVRYHLFAEYKNEEIDPGLPVGMRHTVLPGEAVDAFVEIGVEDREALNRLLVEHPVTDDDLDVLSGAHAYRKYKKTTDFVVGGEITSDGIRTPFVMDLIRELGAISQEHPGLDRLMLTGSVD